MTTSSPPFLFCVCVLPENQGGERAWVRKGEDVWAGTQRTGKWPQLKTFFNNWLPVLITFGSLACETLPKSRSSVVCLISSLSVSFVLNALFGGVAPLA